MIGKLMKKLWLNFLSLTLNYQNGEMIKIRTTIECLECLSHSFTKVVKNHAVNEEQGYEI